MAHEIGIQTANLDNLLQEIAHDHPDGLRHAEFVTALLERGYINRSRERLSNVVHQALMRLVNNGVLVKQEDEGGVREYMPASACA
jgi:hypothetical protein